MKERGLEDFLCHHREFVLGEGQLTESNGEVENA